jgi:transcription antitermination protein NusB
VTSHLTSGTDETPEETEDDEEWDRSALPPRRQARAVAFQALFELDMTQHDPEDVLGWALDGSGLAPTGVAFARRLVVGVRAHQQALDDRIRRLAPAWPLHQLAIVDRNLLRVAMFEIVIEKRISPRVAINEAVELAKLFGGESSPRFVNGVLGSVVETEDRERE